MPLLDHFHEPLNPRARWESFHHRWANAIADSLDGALPAEFFARVEVHLGTDVATDVSENQRLTDVSANGEGGIALQTYSPPKTTMVIRGQFLEATEIQVRSQAGERLLGVIELVSEANKCSPTNRAAFAAKLASYILSGVGVVVIDTVTNSRFNLHDQFVSLLSDDASLRMADTPSIYAAAYRPASQEQEQQIDTWLFPLDIGMALPTVPFYLCGHGCIPLDLEATYMETRKRSNLK